LGAGSGRLIAGKVVQERWELREMSRFPTPVCSAGGDYLCWEIDGIEARVREGLTQCAFCGPVVSVGVDSWGVDFVLLDAERQRLGKAVCYRDKRTEGMIERVQARLSAEEIYRRSGIQFQRYNTLYQLAAAAEQEPGWMASARHLLMIPDYLHYRLSGVLSNEYTNATTTQMVGLNGQWDEELLKAAGLNRNLMLPPTDAATVLGEMPLGIGSIQVIAPATHDTASAVAGAPLESVDEAYISSGTWSLMGIESRTPFETPEAMRMNFTNEGGVERRYRALKNIMGMWLFQRISEEFGIKDVAALVAEASEASAWRSVVNPDDAVFLNPANMTETIRAFCRQTGQPEPATPAQLARCVFDSLALSYRNVKEELESLRQRKLTRIRIIGGGSQNRLLNQLCADACQLPVSAGPVEASALGNLSAQSMALGVIEDLDAARALIRRSFPPQEFLPQAAIPDAVWSHFQRVLKTNCQERAARA
jgi:rhamnulokinase